MVDFRLADTPFDTAPLRLALLSSGAGAYASFEGWVRDSNDGRPVQSLAYEAYAVLAEAEGRRILGQARERFAIVNVGCVHRVGQLEIGELAVWVGASAAHRVAAFDACRWVIDEVKRSVPIWKREKYVGGDADWLHPLEGGGQR